jgi:hypothetical protein
MKADESGETPTGPVVSDITLEPIDGPPQLGIVRPQPRLRRRKKLLGEFYRLPPGEPPKIVS